MRSSASASPIRSPESTITAFSTASQTFFQTISFRSGIQGSNALEGIVTSLASFSYSYNTVNNPVRPRTGKEFSGAMQVAGIWGNVRYFSSVCCLQELPLDALPDARTRAGTTCSRFARSLAISRALAAMLRRRRTASTAGGEAELRGFDVRSATPYGYVPTRQTVQLTNPDGTCVPRDPEQSTAEPVHPGSDTCLRHCLHRRRHQLSLQRSNTASRSSVPRCSRSSTTSALDMVPIMVS